MSLFSAFAPSVEAWRQTAAAVDRDEIQTRTFAHAMAVALCSGCGRPTARVRALCSCHAALGDDWSRANRLWCSFFHRGVPIPRLPERERAEPWWVAGVES